MNISMRASAAHGLIVRRWIGYVMALSVVNSMPSQNPFGDTPQGKLLTQMQGMIAEYERAQILERMRRGRLQKGRRGELIPWAYRCYGYRYLLKRTSDHRARIV